jgi:hypothetical protein
VRWENTGGWKGDDSLRSFLFTLRNPHGVPPRKFALKAEKKQDAIYGNSAYSAVFGGWDILVCSHCNAHRDSYTRISNRWSDRTYANDTAFEDFLTGAEYFTVKEIEVFEIADEIVLPADVKKCANGRLSKREREMQALEQPGGSGRHRRATARGEAPPQAVVALETGVVLPLHGRETADTVPVCVENDVKVSADRKPPCRRLSRSFRETQSGVCIRESTIALNGSRGMPPETDVIGNNSFERRATALVQTLNGESPRSR